MLANHKSEVQNNYEIYYLYYNSPELIAR